MERYECRKELKENIDYERLRREHPRDDIDNLPELMLDVVCSTAPTIRISGSDIPTETVKDRVADLNFKRKRWAQKRRPMASSQGFYHPLEVQDRCGKEAVVLRCL